MIPMDKVSKKRRVSANMKIDEQKSSLSSLISNPPENTRIIEFSPELASYVLENLNINNRTKKPKNIKRYANDMATGNWSLTGDTLQFSKKGILMNGQNRLSACVRAGVPFVTHVAFGIEATSRVHMDVGKVRNNADLFHGEGVPYPNETGKGIRMIMAWKSGKTDARGIDLDLREMLELYNNVIDKSVLELCIKKAKAVKRHTSYPEAHLIALMYFAWRQGHSEKVKKFMDDMIAGYGNGPRSPVRLLLSTVSRLRMDRFNTITPHMYAIMLTRSWNNYLDGKASKVSDMSVTLDDPLPVDTSM